MTDNFQSLFVKIIAVLQRAAGNRRYPLNRLLPNNKMIYGYIPDFVDILVTIAIPCDLKYLRGILWAAAWIWRPPSLNEIFAYLTTSPISNNPPLRMSGNNVLTG